MKLHVDLEAYWVDSDDESDLYISDEVFAMISMYEHCGDEYCTHCHRYPEKKLWEVKGLGSIESGLFRSLSEAKAAVGEAITRMFTGVDVVISNRAPQSVAAE